MEYELNDIEARVLGSLMEKDMATPDYYPLSLNALVNACNQKSNRNPVVNFDEVVVVRALDSLKEKHLAYQSDASRVPKYAHNFDKALNLVRKETAVICLLLLRGPQTLGELRGRSERLYSFGDLAEVEEVLASLDEMELIKKMPRQPGRKESRYAQLLSGEPEDIDSMVTARPEGATITVRSENEKIAALEKEVEELRNDLTVLQEAFSEFKEQFE